MAGEHRTIAAITALLGLMQSSCASGDADAEFDQPPESTYMVSMGQLHHEDEVTEVQLAQVTTEFFAVISRPPWLGRTFVAQEFAERAEPVVVLSHELWEDELGGRPEIVGGTLQLDGRDRTVIGVMPPAIEWPPGVQLWIPQSSQP